MELPIVFDMLVSYFKRFMSGELSIGNEWLQITRKLQTS